MSTRPSTTTEDLGTSVDPDPVLSQLSTLSQTELDTSVDPSENEFLRRQLHQANEQLSMERDKSLCVVCLDKTREMNLKPCNHCCLCSSCSRRLRECPVCKERIIKAEKVYL